MLLFRRRQHLGMLLEGSTSSAPVECQSRLAVELTPLLQRGLLLNEVCVGQRALLLMPLHLGAGDFLDLLLVLSAGIMCFSYARLDGVRSLLHIPRLDIRCDAPVNGDRVPLPGVLGERAHPASGHIRKYRPRHRSHTRRGRDNPVG